ncbi:MAG: ABC transporter permease subunit, partial [Candidatus Kariarchaeaceae archaeon]
PITETVFTWPGLGIHYVAAIFIIDMSLILGITMILTILILLSNLVTDIIYAVIDPRITI